MTDVPRVVSREWLADHLDAVRVVDVREPWEFEGIGHVPGAVNVPFDEFRSEGADVGQLPGLDAWNELLSGAGVVPDDTLVAYDDTHGVFAARFVVTALVYGHEDVHLLDGDFSAWNREYDTESGPATPDRTEYVGHRNGAVPLVDAGAVLDALDTDAVVVDTREEWEYDEGHIPGAKLLDWREFVDEETRGLKPEADLRDILESHGITPDRRVVLYCNTARRISHTYVVLDQLGYEDVQFFEGSLTEWRAVDGPLETA
ncbi:sulfurtransferase [Haloarchaeobius sp. HRN-SO-5]|uniref:sulfurtransferase n=1 Tax=Haloarchaeobius sp. HRN-SO-5 TaxID=3446118 RepID=UPI003EBFFE5F